MVIFCRQLPLGGERGLGANGVRPREWRGVWFGGCARALPKKAFMRGGYLKNKRIVA